MLSKRQSKWAGKEGMGASEAVSPKPPTVTAGDAGLLRAGLPMPVLSYSLPVYKC